MEQFIRSFIVGVFVLFLLVVAAFLSCLCLAWAWNFIMPMLWHAAPHITWVHAVAISILLGAVKGIIQFSTTVNKNKS